MEDLERAGGVYAVMKELTKKDLLDTSLITCTGKTIAENLEGVENRDPEIIRPIDNPYLARAAASPCCGATWLQDGCVVKQSAVAPEMMVHSRSRPGVSTPRRRPLRISTPGSINPGDVVVIRYEGPKGGPGMREMLNPTSAICGMGLGEMRGSDHRRPLLRRHPRRFHRPRQPGGRCRRHHRPGGRGGYDLHRHPQLLHRRWRSPTRSWPEREGRLGLP